MSLTMTKVYSVLNDAFPGHVISMAHGVELEHKGRILLRVERGSGIGGRGDIWAITFPGFPRVMEPTTNIETAEQLRRALSDLILSMFHLAMSLKRLEMA